MTEKFPNVLRTTQTSIQAQQSLSGTDRHRADQAGVSPLRVEQSQGKSQSRAGEGAWLGSWDRSKVMGPRSRERQREAEEQHL